MIDVGTLQNTNQILSWVIVLQKIYIKNHSHILILYLHRLWYQYVALFFAERFEEKSMN